MERLLRQVKQVLDAVALNQARPPIKCVLAVSGGVDSMVMWHCMKQVSDWRDYQDVELIIAHFNHQLRSESDEEQRALKTLAHRQTLAYYTATWAYPADHNIEAAARQARYAFLADVVQETGASVIMTGHHLDDASETWYLKTTRGSSLKGLGGMPTAYERCLETSQGESVTVRHLRPLLTSRKSDICWYAQQHQLRYFEDASNNSLDYFRNRLRHQLIPALNEENPNLAVQIADMQRDLRASYQVHRLNFRRYVQAYFHQEGATWLLKLRAWRQLSLAEQRIYLQVFFEEDLIDRSGGYHYHQLEIAIELLANPTSTGKHHQLGGAYQLRIEREWAYFEPMSGKVGK